MFETETDKKLAQVELCPDCGKQYPAGTDWCPLDGGHLVRQFPDPMIGVALPRHYRITDRLGRGAMSVVYQGLYEPLNQPVAVKLLKSHLVSDLSTFKRFQQEAKTAGALEHPNIVGIFDFGVTDQGVPYLIMEMLKGESLNERLMRVRNLSVHEAISVFSQAADALHYTHERGIVHRDVKPSNILLVPGTTDEVLVKIVDFGIAKLQAYDGNSPTANLTATGEVFGTPLYVSPEQAMGRALDWRADIYSLGCVMYEAITGVPPFSAGTAFDVIRLQITASPESMEELRPDLFIPPALSATVARMMAKSPDARYQSMADVLVDLDNALTQADANRALSRPMKSSDKTPTEALRAYSTPSPARNQEGARGTDGRSGVSSAANPVYSSSNHKSFDPAVTTRGGMPLRPPTVILFALSTVCGVIVGIGILLCTGWNFNKIQAEAPANAATTPSITTSGASGLQASSPASAAQQCITDMTKAVAANDFVVSEAQGKKAVALLESLPKKKATALDLAKTLRTLGIISHNQKHYDAAETYFKKAKAIHEKYLGTDNAETAQDAGCFGRLYESQGKFDLAEQSYKQALNISARIYGHASPRLVNRLADLSDVLKHRKKFVEADALDREAKAISAGKD